MELNLDQVRQELADIHEELYALPQDDFSRRVELKDRQHALRQMSAKLVGDQPMHDAASLNAAHERLHKVRDKLLEKHLQLVSASGGDAGIDGVFTTTINSAMGRGMELDEIEEKLKEIIGQIRSSA